LGQFVAQTLIAAENEVQLPTPVNNEAMHMVAMLDSPGPAS
jgi:hypothetical protein